MTYMSKKSFREGLSLIGCAVWGSFFNSLNIHFLHPYLRENELGFLGSGLSFMVGPLTRGYRERER